MADMAPRNEKSQLKRPRVVCQLGQIFEMLHVAHLVIFIILIIAPLLT